jgi:glycerol-3-phosphate dehydrogenase (NAD(P)+)
MSGTTAVIGTGTWGTATAVAMARRGGTVLLYGRNADKVAELKKSRRHPLLPQTELPASLGLTANKSDLSGADLVLWAVPTQHTAEQARLIADAISANAHVVSLSKGLEQGTLRRVSEILSQSLRVTSIGCASGPSHAVEVLAGLPACLVVAGPDAVAQRAVERMHGKTLRLYTTADLIGVELGGALKNVIAIAAGICDGLKLGDNMKAAMVTRGVAEMRRLGRAMRANDSTFSGMAGVGDLLTTCYSPHGRNRALGLAIAQGEDAQHYLASRQTVAEGAWTCRAAVELGRRNRVELPIASQVASVIWDAKPVRQAIEELLSRAPKEEDA